MNEKLREAVEKIIKELSDDISDRCGIKHEWERIDAEVMNGEIIPEWRNIIITPLKSLFQSTQAEAVKARPKIICLCGSTRFKDTFMQVAKDLTCEGINVLAPFHFRHTGDIITPELEEVLSQLHFRKIDLADEVFILNVGGYIGEHLKAEIEYATAKGKPIKYLEALSGEGK